MVGRGEPASPSVGERDIAPQGRGSRWVYDPGATVIGSSESRLVTSELVTNAVIHSGAEEDAFVCVAVQFRPGRVSVSVSDPGLSGRSVEVRPNGGSDGGFGLRVVDQLASSWGSERQPSGRYRVWAELPLHK